MCRFAKQTKSVSVLIKKLDKSKIRFSDTRGNNVDKRVTSGVEYKLHSVEPPSPFRTMCTVTYRDDKITNSRLASVGD